MKSPFPGMDPYLESHWGDVQASLMVYSSRSLNEQLPEDLHSRIVETEPIPDPRTDEKPTLRHLEIREWDNDCIVTAIEVLSPANKIGVAGQEAYRRKQEEYVNAQVNLVEIDLLLAGGHVLFVPEGRLPPSCRTPYRICVCRQTRPGLAEFYPISLREPLPTIRIPLRPKDADVLLNLQALLDDAYRDGRYHTVNYREDPTPRLDGADAQWADELLRSKSLR